MVDRSTAGIVAEPEEVEAVLHNLCGYHLAEPDPLYRYSVLTREQVLYGALIAAIKRERGRALAELAVGRTLTQVGQLTGLGSRQRVQRLIAIAKAADEAAAAVQAASIAFEEQQQQLASAVAALQDPSDLDAMPVAAPATAESPSVEMLDSPVVPVMPETQIGGSPPAGAEAGTRGEPAPTAGGEVSADATQPDPSSLLEPTLMMPALAAVLQPTKELEPAKESLSTQDDDIAWWRHEADTGAA